jgi:hypothetical protein
VNICTGEERPQILAMKRGFNETILALPESHWIFILSFYPEHSGYLVEREGAISRVITFGD